MEQAPKHEWPTIPVPTTDPDSLNASVIALKQAVEMLIGTRGADNAERNATMYIQNGEPEAKDGAFWLSVGAPQTTLNVSVNGKWHIVGTLT